MPWDLIRTLIVETYGGKIDDAGDFDELRLLVEKFIVPEAYEDDHRLVESKSPTADGESLQVPSGTSISAFTEWVTELPEREPPTFLGLPANAEKLLLVGQGNSMIKNLARVQEVLDEGEQTMGEAAVGA